MSAVEARIHPTAVVEPGAIIGPGCTIGPYSVIGSHVVLGAENIIGPHAVIEGHTRIGNKNRIFQFASVGSAPQDLKFKGEPSQLVIGDGNIIREYATLQPGTEGGGMLTKIGDRNLFMVSSHVGHDCTIGDRCVFANSVALAGHVTVGSGVILGGLCGIHQFVRLGDVSMIGAGAMVSKDIPPFCIAQGDRAELVGVNAIGLGRAGFGRDDVSLVRRLYRTLFIRSEDSSAPRLTLKQRIETLWPDTATSVPGRAFLTFVQDAKRGVPKHRGADKGEDSAD